MKSIILISMLLVLLAGCASTDGGQSDPRVSYGGSYRVRAGVSHGVGK